MEASTGKEFVRFCLILFRLPLRSERHPKFLQWLEPLIFRISFIRFCLVQQDILAKDKNPEIIARSTDMKGFISLPCP
jgi:hypothetical protein